MSVKERYYRGPQDRKRISFIHHTLTILTDDKCTAVLKSIASLRKLLHLVKGKQQQQSLYTNLKLADTLKKEYFATFSTLAISFNGILSITTEINLTLSLSIF